MADPRRWAVIGVIAWCTDCDWTSSDYKTAREEASLHAHRQQHRVEAEVTTHVRYGKKP